MNILDTLKQEFNMPQAHVENVLSLLEEGNTIPFIARYRKEMHGSTDDQTLRKLAERAEYLQNLETRKEEVSRLIDEQGKLNEEISQNLAKAKNLAEVEDIYRPYRAKRKTRASVAKAKGLDPLAQAILAQQKDSPEPIVLAKQYVNPENEINDAEEALAGALDIIAEDISNKAELRQTLRQLFMQKSILRAEAVDTEQESVYEVYYDFSEAVRSIAGYRILAINRGEREKLLKVSVELDEVLALQQINKQFLSPGSACTPAVESAAADAYKRLIYPSLEREIRNTLTERAEKSAIVVFSENLRNLLMVPPIKGQVTLGLDPGFRTGCKLAVIDETGRVLDTGVIYNTAPHNKVKEAEQIVKNLIEKHKVSLIAIGNGTASRESEQFIAELLPKIDRDLSYIIVNEAGASVYSASALAAEEFPEFDVSIRSAVSIARRLQDALAELVKIDPKSIGVGQYQHDMPKAELDTALGSVVEDCVNAVGVDLNTASAPLLRYIAGINESVAKNIVTYREENGAFLSRKILMKVPKLGKKTFEQCAGFLRVAESKNILDKTGVHPESYKAAETLLKLCDFSLDDVKEHKIHDLPEIIRKKGEKHLAESIGIGLPTLLDICKELMKPGRDPRDELPKPLLRKDVLDLEDLEVGMELSGTVRNVIDFGAFVDIGVHQDGLVHISQLSDQFVKKASDIVQVGDIVKVKVLEVDIKRKRIALSMKGLKQTQLQ